MRVMASHTWCHTHSVISVFVLTKSAYPEVPPAPTGSRDGTGQYLPQFTATPDQLYKTIPWEADAFRLCYEISPLLDKAACGMWCHCIHQRYVR